MLVARTSGDPAVIAADLRQVIKTYDSDISIVSVQPLTTWVSEPSLSLDAARSCCLRSPASPCCLRWSDCTASSPIRPRKRTSEIGLRVAIGAQRSDAVRLVLREGAKLAAAGTALGVVGADAASDVLSSFVYGVNTTDVSSFIAASVCLVLVALLACYLPARRAAPVDPAVALRAE